MTEPVDRAALRALAEAATSGPWVVGDRWTDGGGSAVSCVNRYDDVSIEGAIVQAVNGEWPDEPNAAFIAAADPSTVLALLARLDEAEGLLAEATGTTDWSIAAGALWDRRARAFLAPSTPTETE